MFRRILIAGWVLIFAGVLFFNIFPTLLIKIPRSELELIRPCLLVFILISIVYGIVWLYRQGMKRAKSK